MVSKMAQSLVDDITAPVDFSNIEIGIAAVVAVLVTVVVMVKGVKILLRVMKGY